MAAIDDKLGSHKRFAFSSSSLPADTFAVVSLSGTEAVSKPYEFELHLVSENSRIDLQKVIDQAATLTIHPRGQGHMPVPYHGLIKEFDQSHQVDRYTFYRALLAPRIWDLSLDKISEVYLDQTIPQIIEKELQGNGLSSNDYALGLGGSYKPWPYFCQYQETDLDFISRIMEREGIYYYFEQGKDREKLTITDAKSFHAASARTARYHPASQLDTGLTEDAVRSWLCKQRPVPRTVVLQDYNAETAALALMAEAEVAPDGKGEHRIYNENFRVPAEGKRLAQIRAEEILSRRRVFYGEGSATGLQAGYFMQLEGHYRPDFNGRYLVTEVRHEGSQRGALLAGLDVPGETAGRAAEDFYRSECTAIPADVQFRPERTTPRPLIHGTMTAFVDAEGSGQYAELNEQGRYKVQLPFDKTDKGPDKASAWIRMASPYSGKDHGMHFPLHKGAEVLLSFVDGDPNQPIIVGAVPNSENLNLVTRKNQTQSVLQTAGTNLILMEDEQDHEKIHIGSPKGNSKLVLGAADADAAGGGGSNEAYIYSSTLGDTVSISQGRDITVTGWYPPGGSEPTDDTVILPPDLPYGNDLSAIPPGVTIEYNNAPYSGLIKADFTETVTGNFDETHVGTSTEHLQGNVTEIIGVAGKWVNKFEMIWGSEEGIVWGPKVDTAMAATTDVFLGALGIEFFVGLKLDVHIGPEIEVHNTHINATDTEIEALQTRLRAVQTSLAATESDISAVESKMGVVETVLESHGQDIRATEMTINTHGQKIEAAEANIETIGTTVESCETAIHNNITQLADHEVALMNAGLISLA